MPNSSLFEFFLKFHKYTQCILIMSIASFPLTPLPFLGSFKKYPLNPVIAVRMCIDVGPPTGGMEGESVASLFKTSQGPPDYTVPGLSCLSEIPPSFIF